MKREMIDYKDFRLNKINEPRFRHLKLLASWIGYFAMYFLTENLIPERRCAVMHCALDDMIPFCEFFAIFYVGWFALLFFSLLHYLLYDAEKFSDLQKFIIITQVIAMFCYVFFPSMQDLRPEVFPRENIFTEIIGALYYIDTPTGVCPSLHVAYSVGILSVWLKDENNSKPAKALMFVFIVLICMSTSFIKQHSMIDVTGGLLTGLAAEIIIYGKKYWLPRFKAKTA